MHRIKKSENFIPLVFIIIISLIYSWPFFHPGIFTTDDGIWAIIRLAEMTREIRDLQIPPRWSDFLNHGFGYPLFNFTYPLPFYLGALLKLIGFSAVASVKILFASSVMISGILMFFFVKKITRPFLGLLSSLFYISAPYRLIDLYDRGSLGESLSFILFPLIFHLTFFQYEKPSLLKSSLLSIALGMMFLTHNIMAMLFIPAWFLFAILLIFFSKKNVRLKLLIDFFRILLLGISLSAYFILPALFEKKYIYLSIEKLANQSEYFFTPLAFIEAISIPVLIAVFISIYSYWTKKLKLNPVSGIMYFYSIIMTLISSLLTQRLSLFIWQLPPLSVVDFPWRMMGLVVFFSSVVIGFIAKNKIIQLLCVVLVLYNLIMNFSLIVPGNGFYTRDEAYFFTNDATTTSKDELTPIWAKIKPEKRYSEKVEIKEGKAQISDLFYNSKEISFMLKAETRGVALINTIYYPGWQFEINNRDLPIRTVRENGLISFLFESGDHEVKGKFKETPLRLIADLVSLSGLLFIISKFIYVKKI